MATKKKSAKKTKTTKPRATKAKKTGKKRLWGAALAKHNEKLARMGKPPVAPSAPAASKPVPAHKRLHPPRPPGAKPRRPVTPPKRHRTKMVPASDVARVKIAMEAKHAADELAEATRDLKKLKNAVSAAKTAPKAAKKHGRKKFGKRQKAAASAAFKSRHGLSPAEYLKSKRPGKKTVAKNERRVTAKELLAKPGTKAAAKATTRAAKTLKGKSLHVWLCAGPKRTGCGGGKKGGHVIGMLR